MSNIILPRIWKPLNDPDFGFMETFSRSVASSEAKDKYLLPNLRRGQTILVTSDYSGQNDLADYHSLSFLFADLQGCNLWDAKRRQLRKRYLSDGRRMSFKNLNDNKRRKAFTSFLSAANTIPGLNVTVLVDKEIQSLSVASGRIDMKHSSFQPYSHWNRSSFEKMLIIIHIICFFIAGLSAPNQDVIWITDEDEIAANEARLRELTVIWGNVINHYLSHNLGHLRCGTTKSDDGSRSVEDLVSIPDLVAGALAEFLTAQSKAGLIPNSSFIIPNPENISNKTAAILNWFSTNIQPLKRLVYVIQAVKGTNQLSLKRLKFHGSLDYDI